LILGGIVNAWYTLDHDEYIKLPYLIHHKYINSNYGVYLPDNIRDEKDNIRNLIKR
jgi:hypothetical protein